MTIGAILHPTEGDVRHERLIILSPDETCYLTVCEGTRREILRYAEENNITIKFY